MMYKWERNVHAVTKTVGKHYHESYSAVVHVIQLEWIFFNAWKKDMGHDFAGVEKFLWETFLFRIFCENQKHYLPL